ncbi:MAG: hypothetical protein PF450_08560, partial [Bacteroidales bacterium]|nr:hypothetical protein [Bacteroidales bacterium]
MRGRISFVACIVFSFSGLMGQINPYGLPEVVNYPPDVTNGSEQNWSAVQDNRGIMYFGNTDKGVLEYDGNEWRTIPIPNKSIVRSLACAEDGTVYVGAVTELGYLSPSSSGLLTYNSLLPKLDSVGKQFSDVWKIFITEDKVYYYSEKNMYVFYPETNILKYFPVEKHTLFSFYENDKIYAGNFLKGLMLLQGDSVFVQLKGGDFYIQDNIFALTRYDEDHLLVSGTESGLSLFNPKTGKVNAHFASESTTKLVEGSFVTQIAPTSNDNFVISTYGGGIAILNREGDISEVISSKEGLQDQIVYSFYQAKDRYPYSHYWTTMSMGIGKVNFESPIRQFSEQSGYEGLIHSINSIDNRIFIGTESGLFAST